MAYTPNVLLDSCDRALRSFVRVRRLWQARPAAVKNLGASAGTAIYSVRLADKPWLKVLLAY